MAARALLQLEHIPPVDDSILQAVHPGGHLLRLRAACEALAAPAALADPDDPDGPSYGAPESYAHAVHAASAAVALVDAVMAQALGPCAGFSICRPPGHHAAAAAAAPLGVCFINSAAVAARHAQRRHGAQRVAILDFDVHHGNGTQDTFYADPSVLFIDVHRAGVWPGSGAVHETGAGAGAGATINIPLPDGSGHAAALEALRRVVAPALRRFRPGLILVSAGYDAHHRDPLETLQFQSATYHALAAGVRELAAELCGGKVVCVLEGGYHVEALAESVGETARALEGRPAATLVAADGELPRREPAEEVEELLDAVVRMHGLEEMPHAAEQRV